MRGVTVYVCAYFFAVALLCSAFLFSESDDERTPDLDLEQRDWLLAPFCFFFTYELCLASTERTCLSALSLEWGFIAFFGLFPSTSLFSRVIFVALPGFALFFVAWVMVGRALLLIVSVLLNGCCSPPPLGARHKHLILVIGICFCYGVISLAIFFASLFLLLFCCVHFFLFSKF